MDLGQLILALQGAEGVYNPLFNSVVLKPNPNRPNDDLDQWAWNDVYRHEHRHKDQYNRPGSYYSKEDRDIWRDSEAWKTLKKRGYAEREIPLEIDAFTTGSNTSEFTGGQYQSPQPGWSSLTDKQKLWLLKNREGYLTNQDYLERGNFTTSNAYERSKHLFESLKGGLMSLFEN